MSRGYLSAGGERELGGAGESLWVSSPQLVAERELGGAGKSLWVSYLLLRPVDGFFIYFFYLLVI